MDTQYIPSLYAYNTWANDRILDTADQLSAAQLTEPGMASFGSVRDTLVHTMSAQWIWLSRWQGTSPTAMYDPAKAFPENKMPNSAGKAKAIPGQKCSVYG